jgi:hypothetical protein
MNQSWAVTVHHNHMSRDSDVDSGGGHGSTRSVYNGLGWLLGMCVGPRPMVETLTTPLLEAGKASLDNPREQLKAPKGGESRVTKGRGSTLTKGDKAKATQPETACRLIQNASPDIPKHLQLGPDAQLVYMKDTSAWVRPSHLCVCRVFICFGRERLYTHRAMQRQTSISIWVLHIPRSFKALSTWRVLYSTV